MKLDTIIAVKDVEASARWYEQVFGFKSNGVHLAVLKDEHDEIVLCLHPWDMDEHPTMVHPEIAPGNGLILYFKTHNFEAIYQRVLAMGIPIEEALHVNPKPNKKEFSFRDPDGYFLTVTEYHEYQ